MGSIHQDPILDVVVIGAGFGGCYMLHLLRKEGFQTLLLEAGGELGGVWCWSRYPGARVDCEFPYYGFSDPAIWSTFVWKERFPSDKELRAYFQHVAKVWDLHGDIKLNNQVVEAAYDEDNACWRVRTAGPQVQTFRCRWLIAATGTSFKQHIPEWKGRDRYTGVIHHSASWPRDQDVSLLRKRVAIIGAGASGVQVMQEAAKQCSHVTQFIRTPNLAIPMRQRSVSEEELYAYKPLVPHSFNACRTTSSGMPFIGSDVRVFDDDPEQRKARLEECWKRGGFNWPSSVYGDYLIDPEANRELYKFWCEKTRQRIRDPVKRDLLAPLELPYYIYTKRPSLEQDYYECCDQANVEITNSPIVEFTETGIVTEDGKHHEFDIVVICTGYDAVTGGLRTMGIKGRNAVDISEKWSDGVVTHLGMLVNGYPNFLMIYGPQAPTSLTNGPPFLEIQCEYILKVLVRQRQAKIRTIEAGREAEQEWRSHVLELADQTLLVKTDSWWMGTNIPGKRREQLMYVGGIPLYRQKMEEALEDWRGFEIHHDDEQ